MFPRCMSHFRHQILKPLFLQGSAEPLLSSVLDLVSANMKPGFENVKSGVSSSKKLGTVKPLVMDDVTLWDLIRSRFLSVGPLRGKKGVKHWK